jgi:hypothetical protein
MMMCRFISKINHYFTIFAQAPRKMDYFSNYLYLEDRKNLIACVLERKDATSRYPVTTEHFAPQHLISSSIINQAF